MPPANGRRDPQPKKSSSKPKKAPLRKTVPPAPSPVASREILALFQRTFAPLFSSPHFNQLLQTIKGHLYNRDYAAAFGTQRQLEGYVVRWSPSRALCYRSVLLELCPEVRAVVEGSTRGVEGDVTDVVCIGGGAGAELVAVAGAIKALRNREGETAVGGKINITAIDIADWMPIVDTLVKEINSSYVPEAHFGAKFYHADILAEETAANIPRTAKLITMFFTTNELYTQSKVGTTQFLQRLGGMVESGCLLVVLESAGNYSTVKIGDKTFSMGLLLEHTLLGAAGDGGDWTKVVGDDSRWYRLPEGLEYPLALENMRYFVRVFRRN
ncbi:hypothetical protein EDC01DRAFT_654948 [Geopyxis carbonaria]|nr:hypothetical protein EDC01DRAFT_654948 [Geopyxis carbonaria]